MRILHLVLLSISGHFNSRHVPYQQGIVYISLSDFQTSCSTVLHRAWWLCVAGSA